MIIDGAEKMHFCASVACSVLRWSDTKQIRPESSQGSGPVRAGPDN